MTAIVTINGKTDYYGKRPLVRMRIGVCAINSDDFKNGLAAMRVHEQCLEAITKAKIDALQGGAV